MLAAQRAAQYRSTRRRGREPTQNLIGSDRLSVIAEIRIPLRSYYCAFQGHAGKESLALAISVNCSRRCDSARRGAAHRSRSGADIRADA